MAYRRNIPIAMTIAGSDSGGGAGIEADLKTFAALGVHGTVAVTSITAQNTYEVKAIFDLPGWMVYEQIRAVAEDMGIDAAKTGMLSNSDIITNVAKAVRDFNLQLVIDPVMIAKSGARLLREDAIEALRKELIPLAKVVTPNKMEAEALAEISINNIEDAKRAAKIIREKYGCESVVVKGGHLEGDKAIDVLYYRDQYYFIESEKIMDACLHGGGCTYSAAIAAYLAKGLDVVSAVRKAKEFITTAIKYGLRLGKGHCPVNPMAWLEIPAERYNAIKHVENAVQLVLNNSEKIYKYAPEVGINIVEAISPKYLRSTEDVAGVLGRVVKARGKLMQAGPVEFGASDHLARLVMEITRYNPEFRAALNIRYDKNLVDNATRKNYVVVFVDRRLEPQDIRSREGMSMKWLVEEAFKKANRVPDIIYDMGDIGKEPMIRILGRDALEVVNKLLEIIE
ncbi:MAG: bifunctional hydroxymethylpyrimidine kinase/phosphomethylpyrimidine kinase [Desulfurococcaceae archaeon]